MMHWLSSTFRIALIGLFVFSGEGELFAQPIQWTEPGIPIRQCRSSEFADDVSQVLGAAGDALVVWSEERKADRDIYAQIIDANNQMIGDTGGFVIVNEIHGQRNPIACPVSGGFVIAWVDFRVDRFTGSQGLGGDIYAQKIAFDGTRLWTAFDTTGIPVDISAHDITSSYNFYSVPLRVIADTIGGAFIVWQEYAYYFAVRLGIQHIDSSGVLTFPESMYIGPEHDLEYRTDACGDGFGNLLITWIKSLASDTSVRVSKISASGVQMWGPSGTVAISGVQSAKKANLCADGEGGCYFLGGSRTNPRVQHVDAQGNRLLGNQGIPAPLYHAQTAIHTLAPSKTDGMIDGCLMAASYQFRDTSVYIQKMLADHTVLWGDSGRGVCNAGFLIQNPRTALISDGSGGALLLYKCYQTIFDCLPAGVFRFDAAGAPVWEDCIAVPFESADAWPISGLGIRNGQVLFASKFLYNGSQYGDQSAKSVCLQAIDLNSGSILLGDSDFVFLNDGGGESKLSNAFASLGGQAFVYWHDDAAGDWEHDYQIIDATGNRVGLPPSEPIFLGWELYVRAHCSDESGGAFFAAGPVWTDENQRVLVLTHIDSSGTHTEPENGIVWDTVEELGGLTRLSADQSGGCFAAVTERYDADFRRVKLSRFNSVLAPYWPATVLMEDATLCDLTTTSVGNCVVVTSSTATSDSALVAWCFNNLGDLIWSQVILDTGTVHAYQLDEIRATAVHAGGVYIAWPDDRRLTDLSEVYVQSISSNGEELWIRNGIPICLDAAWQKEFAFDVGSDDHLYVVWLDATDVGHAQRIRPNGDRAWGNNGLRISDVTYESMAPQIVCAVDLHDHLTAAWTIGPNYFTRVCGIQLDSTGQTTDPYWIPEQGNVISDSLGYGSEPSIAADDQGGVFVSYTRITAGDRGWQKSIYAQYLLDGEIVVATPRTPIPKAFSLRPCYPNPFNPVTTISLSVPVTGPVKVVAYDLQGRVVMTLVNGQLNAGEHRVRWDARGLASGVYFVRMTPLSPPVNGGRFESQTRKVVLLK